MRCLPFLRVRKTSPNLLRAVEKKVFGNFVHHPGFGIILKRAQHDRIAFATKINAQIGIAPDWQLIKSARLRFGHHIVMFHWVQRIVDAAAQTQFTSPHTAR
jgi:hypothetical protein